MSSAEGMGRRIARGATWMIGMRMAIRGLGVISTIILARLLTPADFGLVAMAMAVGAALEAVLEPNFAGALLSDPSRDRSLYNAAWSWSILKGVLVGFLLVLAAPWIADYFRDKRIVSLVYVFAGMSAVSGFQNISTIDFVKDLQLHKSFVMGFGAKILSFAATITAAVIARDYWALIIGMFVQRAATIALSFMLSDYRPRFNFKGSVGLLSFSAWQMISNIVGAAVSQLDALMMGRLASARALGIYEVALEVSALPATEIVTPARQALIGGMVNWLDDRKKFAANYTESLAIMLSVCLPLSAGLAMVSEPVVRVVLGEQWLEAAPLITILVFSGLVRMFSENASTALVVLRQPRINTVTLAITSFFYVFFLYYGITRYGILGAAVARAATSAINLMLNSIILRRYLDTSLGLAFRLSYRTLVATAVMVAVLLGLGMGQPGAYGLPAIQGLLLAVATGMLVFAVVHGIFWAILGRGNGVEGRILRLAASFAGLTGRQAPS